MIKSLRRKFIIIAMCSLVAVLGIIIAIINIANYHKINQSADVLLDILAENGGDFPKEEFTHDSAPAGQKPPGHQLSPEDPFATRYFTVTLRADGSIYSVNTGRIAAVSAETAAAYAEELYKKGRSSGYCDRYKYRMVSGEGEVQYIFLDCGKDISTFYSFLLASILVSTAGILLVFVLVLFFSKIAVKPVAESYAKQKQFITDASHEIKTPLTIIEANTEVLEMEKGESEWIESIRNQIKRLCSLTDKLVLLSRMEEERVVLRMTDFSLSDAVYETAKPFEAVAAAKNRTFTMNVQEGISLHGDEGAIRQLVSLLLDNAMKYSEENGFVSLCLQTDGRSRELILKNSVEKIQTGKLDILFERFYRRDASRNSETGGYGIGLSAAKAIVLAHKGRITAKSEDGHSITFTVRF